MTLTLKTTTERLASMLDPLCDFGEDFLIVAHNGKLVCAAIDGSAGAFIIVQAPLETLGATRDGDDNDHYIDVKRAKEVLKAIRNHGDVTVTLNQASISIKTKQVRSKIPNINAIPFTGVTLGKMEASIPKYGLDSHVMVSGEVLRSATETILGIVHTSDKNRPTGLRLDKDGAVLFAEMDGREFEVTLDPWVGPAGASVTTSVITHQLDNVLHSLPLKAVYRLQASCAKEGEVPLVLTCTVEGNEYMGIVAPLVAND